MRTLIILALMGFSFLVTGCGVVRNVANTLHHEICVDDHNKFVCAQTVSEKPAPRTRLCYGVSVHTKHGVTKIGHTNQGPQCKKLQNETVRKAFESKPGTTCAIEGKGKFQKVVCAGFGHIGGLFLILLTLLRGRGLCDFIVANEKKKGTNRPFDGMWAACKTMIIAIVGIVIILSAGGAYGQPCVNKAYTITQPAEMLECEMVFSTPENNAKYTLAALSRAQDKICSDSHSDIIACYDLYDEARKLFRARASLLLLKQATQVVDQSEGLNTPTPCGESTELCESVDWHKSSAIGLFFSFILSLLTSRRGSREEWFKFEAILYRETRKAIWAIEDELYKARWIERAIEVVITVAAFSVGGLILGVVSALLAQARYGWASILALLLSVLFWGSALEWVLFAVKATMSFLANTDQGFHFVKWALHQRWKRQVVKL